VRAFRLALWTPEGRLLFNERNEISHEIIMSPFQGSFDLKWDLIQGRRFACPWLLYFTPSA
jgi:hypothetical protein